MTPKKKKKHKTVHYITWQRKVKLMENELSICLSNKSNSHAKNENNLCSEYISIHTKSSRKFLIEIANVPLKSYS